MIVLILRVNNILIGLFLPNVRRIRIRFEIFTKVNTCTFSSFLIFLLFICKKVLRSHAKSISSSQNVKHMPNHQNTSHPLTFVKENNVKGVSDERHFVSIKT